MLVLEPERRRQWIVKQKSNCGVCACVDDSRHPMSYWGSSDLAAHWESRRMLSRYWRNRRNDQNCLAGIKMLELSLEALRPTYPVHTAWWGFLEPRGKSPLISSPPQGSMSRGNCSISSCPTEWDVNWPHPQINVFCLLMSKMERQRAQTLIVPYLGLGVGPAFWLSASPLQTSGTGSWGTSLAGVW